MRTHGHWRQRYHPIHLILPSEIASAIIPKIELERRVAMPITVIIPDGWHASATQRTPGSAPGRWTS